MDVEALEIEGAADSEEAEAEASSLRTVEVSGAAVEDEGRPGAAAAAGEEAAEVEEALGPEGKCSWSHTDTKACSSAEVKRTLSSPRTWLWASLFTERRG